LHLLTIADLSTSRRWFETLWPQRFYSIAGLSNSGLLAPVCHWCGREHHIWVAGRGESVAGCTSDVAGSSHAFAIDVGSL